MRVRVSGRVQFDPEYQILLHPLPQSTTQPDLGSWLLSTASDNYVESRETVSNHKLWWCAGQSGLLLLLLLLQSSPTMIDSVL